MRKRQTLPRPLDLPREIEGLTTEQAEQAKGGMFNAFANFGDIKGECADRTAYEEEIQLLSVSI